MNLPNWVTRLQNAWVALGALLIVLGAQGVQVPQFILNIFSQEFVDNTLVVVGSVFTYIQYIRGQVLAGVKNSVAVMALSVEKVRAFGLNPFKTTI